MAITQTLSSSEQSTWPERKRKKAFGGEEDERVLRESMDRQKRKKIALHAKPREYSEERTNFSLNFV